MRVLVTGGTSGLGLAMATALAAAGSAVALTGRSGEHARSVAAALPGAVGLELDVRDESSVARAVDEAWSSLGGLDMLVNNAGIGMRTVNPRFMTEPQGFWQTPVDGFRAVIDTNFTGYFLMAREVTPRLLAAGGGRIVNVSVSDSTKHRAGFSPYGPSRAGSGGVNKNAIHTTVTIKRANVFLGVSMAEPRWAKGTGTVNRRARSERGH